MLRLVQHTISVLHLLLTGVCKLGHSLFFELLSFAFSSLLSKTVCLLVFYGTIGTTWRVMDTIPPHAGYFRTYRAFFFSFSHCSFFTWESQYLHWRKPRWQLWMGKGMFGVMARDLTQRCASHAWGMRVGSPARWYTKPEKKEAYSCSGLKEEEIGRRESQTRAHANHKWTHKLFLWSATYSS